MALTAHKAGWFAAGISLLSFLAPPAGAATPEDGRRAYDAGHFSDAMGIWSDLSRQGNAEASFGLGLLYDVGNGTPEDPATAFFWYKFSAEAGLPEAEFNVAAMYDSGRGVAQNSASAALWYAKAAAHGHHRAQYDLGLLYADGIGVPKNPDAASAWLLDARDGGLSAATRQLKALDTARPTGPLTSVTLSSPARNATLALTELNQAVELVWVAPPEPQPVHYELQVRKLGDSDMQTIVTKSLSETAAVVKFPITPDFYVWSVDAVAKDGTRVASDWNWFSIGAVATPPQSVASVPDAPRTDH